MEKTSIFNSIEEEANYFPTQVDEKNMITAPAGAVYLSDFMTSLPNGIVNKKKTGCGATTVVIENKEDVVVCCPTRQLIINKESQYPNDRCLYKLLAVQKGVTNNDIKDYIQACEGKQPIKIMVTYDSFPRVKEALEELEFSAYKVVVDEYQELLNACVYRNEAIKNLLRALDGMIDVTYLSATPIPYEFKPKELEGLPEYEIEWEEVIKVKPYRLQSNSPFGSVVKIISQHKLGNPFKILGQEVGEYLFFVNSVSAIKRIINVAKLSPEETKIICADNEQNKIRLPDGFSIESATGANKTFTFCTKTVFSGADFYSKAGLIVVVSDRWAKSSWLDISTDILQIAGRIRDTDNPFKDVILHIHNHKYDCQSVNEHRAKLEKELKYAQETIEVYEALSPDKKGVLSGRIKVDAPERLAYYDEEKDTVEIDDLKLKYFQHKFEVLDCVYINGKSIKDAYVNAGFDVGEDTLLDKDLCKYLSLGTSIPKFERQYKLFSNEVKKASMGRTDLANEIAAYDPLVSRAYYILGDEKVEKLGYNEEKIRQHVHFNSPETQAALEEELKNSFQQGRRYSLAEAKIKLSQCYHKFRIQLVPKASDLAKYFDIKKVKLPKIDDRRTDGIEILGMVCRKIEFEPQFTATL